jgi:small subunit ribosomal protein S9
MNENLNSHTFENDEQNADVLYSSVPDERDERLFAANYTATGRRKSSIARVVLSPGNGHIIVNKKPIEEYLPTESMVQHVTEPFAVTDLKGRFDVRVNVHGGGFSGQAGAMRHGISRALSMIDDRTRMQLKAAHMLTRDAREKERKKYGQPGARKRFQFSKR